MIISERFQTLRNSNQCALIPFITASDPDIATTAKALYILDSNGADFIELGVPYSDPLADGPVIQAAATRALLQGTKLEHVLKMLAVVTPNLQAPIILFTYYNPILNLGTEKFLNEIAKVGVKGLVIPDLPLEESLFLIQTAKKFGIEVILLVAPTSSKDRIEAIADSSQGFIYLVSLTGVTGTRNQVQERVKDLIQEMRGITDKPIGVGFGISNAEQAKKVCEWGADAVIVGSAFVQRLAGKNSEDGLKAVKQLCQELKAAVSPSLQTVA